MNVTKLLFVFSFLLPFTVVSSLRGGYTTAKWLLVIVIAAILSGMALYLDPHPRRPIALPRFLIALVGILFTYISFITVIHHVLWPNQTLLESLAFVVLVLSASQLNGPRVAQLWVAISTSTTLLAVFGCMYGLGLFPTEMPLLADISLTVGNTNIAAEYVGFATVYLLVVVKNSNENWSKRLIYGALSVMATFLVVLKSRSVFIALGVLALTWIVDSANAFKVKRRGIGLLVYAAAGFYLSSHSLVSPPNFSSSAPIDVATNPLGNGAYLNKTETTGLRLSLLKATLNLAQDNPLGIGPGQFPYTVGPYLHHYNVPRDQGNYIVTPHNEFLRVLCEYGIPGFMCCFAFFVFVLRAAFAKHNRTSEDIERRCLWPLVVFASVQSLFQFTLCNPISLVWVGPLIGLCLRYEPHVVSMVIPRRILVVLTFLLLAAGTVWGYAMWVIRSRTLDDSHAERACRVWPDRWESCMVHATHVASEGDLEGARAIVGKQLRRSPYILEPLKYWGILTFSDGRRAQGCKALSIYYALRSQFDLAEEQKKLVAVCGDESIPWSSFTSPSSDQWKINLTD